MANPFATAPASANPFAAAAAPAAANPFATAAAAPAAANPFASAAATTASANPFAAATTTAATTAANPFAAVTTTTTAANPFAAATTTAAAANPFAAATATTTANPFATATAAPAAATALGQVGAGAAVHQQEINYDTPFDKLPAALQTAFNQLNASIHETDNYRRVLKQHSSVPLRQLKATLVEVRQSVSTLRNSLQTKSNTVQAVQKQVERDQHHTDMAHLVVRDFSSGFAREVQLPSPFFWQLLHLFEERMRRLGQQIALLEQKLLPHRSAYGTGVSPYDGSGDELMLASGAETNLYTTPAAAGGEGYDGRLTPQLLTRLLVAQNEAFTVLAGSKIAPLHAEVERLKEQYLRIVNDYADAARGGGSRSRSLREDPFRDQDRVEAEAHKRAEASRRIEVPQQAQPATATAAAPAAAAAAANPFAVATTAAANPFAKATTATAANPFATATAANPFATATTPAATANPFANVGAPAPAKPESKSRRRRSGRW